MRGRLLASMLLLTAACQSTASELGGLRLVAPLDYSVLVTGGAVLTAAAGGAGTFAPLAAAVDPAAAAVEPIALADVLAALEQGRVFRRAALDPDAARRARVRQRGDAVSMQDVLHHAREQGFDFLLVVEELQDGPIEWQGINSRWPVTFVTWILLGVGALIPDHTFESRAALRVSVRDLQAGQVLYDQLLTGGPIDLALTERTDVLGLLTSVLVPPFWVRSDADDVRGSVQDVTRRRLLVQLARDLKSAAVRQRLRERSAAAFALDGGDTLVVESAESLSSVRLRVDPPLPPEQARAFAADLLSSLQGEGGRFRYRAPLPPGARGGLVQVLVATIRGAVASATLQPGGGS
jgi:hypothetical protein